MAKAQQRSLYAIPTLADLAVQAHRSKPNEVEASWQELLTANESVANAKDFDTKLLLERMGKGTFTFEEVKVAIDLIACKMKRPNKRPAEYRVKRNRDLARQIIDCWLRVDRQLVIKGVRDWLGKKDLSYTDAIIEGVQHQLGTKGLSYSVVEALIKERRERWYRPYGAPFICSLRFHNRIFSYVVLPQVHAP
jgi:hypothetical protein